MCYQLKNYLSWVRWLVNVVKFISVKYFHARLTAELRKFSVRMESSMQNLSMLANEIIKVVATQRKQKIISGLLDKTEQEVETRKNKNSLQLLQHTIKLMLVKNGGQCVTDLYGRFSISVEHLYPLCRLGQNVAVLAKVNAMYVAEDVNILHGIAEEMDRIINNVEHQLDIVSARFAAY